MKFYSLFAFFLISTLIVFSQGDSLKQPSARAELLRQEAHTLSDSNKFLLAAHKYEASLRVFTALNDSLSMAKCLNNVGYTYALIGKNTQAAKSFYRAIAINKTIGNNDGLYNNYLNLGVHYLKQKYFKLSLKYYQKANNILGERNNLTKKTSILNGMGSIYGNINNLHANLDSALFYYTQAIKINTKANKQSQLGNVYNNIGTLYQNQQNKDSALYYYHTALTLEQKDGISNLQTILNLNIGIIYMDKGHYKIALDYFLVGSELAIKFKDNTNHLHLLTNIIKCKIYLGILHESDTLFTTYNLLNDSIYNYEKTKQLRELEALYESDLTEQELSFQIKETQSKTNLSYWLIGAVIAVVLLLVITILFFKQRQYFQQKIKETEAEKLKINAIMQGQEEERNRIAEDLHDRLGARLSSIRLSSLNADYSKGPLTDMIDISINETREISYNLSTVMLTRFGLANAIEDFIKNINDSNKITGDFRMTNFEKRLPNEFEKAIYYIILELVNNTIKHASASTFFIQLVKFKNEVHLAYEDDGKGFIYSKNESTGMGMKNLQTRIETLQGTYEITSELNDGMHLNATFLLR